MFIVHLLSALALHDIGLTWMAPRKLATRVDLHNISGAASGVLDPAFSRTTLRTGKLLGRRAPNLTVAGCKTLTG